jgi:hypothetical protein
MGRVIRAGWVVCLLGGGCATAPPLDNPTLAGVRTTAVENPVLVSPGIPTPAAYQEVFEKAEAILREYFSDLQASNPYAGLIVSQPRIAPGYEQFWKSGNPDPRARLLATFQTIRQTGTIEIRAGDHGGYLVYVTVDRELEDLARPTQATIGVPVFEEEPTVDRRYQLYNLDITSEPAGSWFKVGRDYALEQVILSRIRNGR